MTTKRNTRFIRTTFPDKPSSGLTSGLEPTIDRDGDTALAVTEPALSAAAAASGPAPFLAAQPGPSTVSSATRTSRMNAVNKFRECNVNRQSGRLLFQSAGFRLNFFPAFVPIDPALRPGLAGKFLPRPGQQLLRNLQHALNIFLLAPLQISFEQAKTVLRVIRRQFN